MFLKNSIRKWLCIFLLATIPWTIWAQSKEYQVKAAFLFNFAQFITWPPTAFADANAPFCIGVLGDDPFGAALDETVQGEILDNRKIIIQRSHQFDDLKNCQVIFVCKSEKNHVAEILSQIDSKPILSVSETDDFDRLGGMINFYLEGTKIRFEINPDAARNSGLKVSSQLLTLGKIVETGKEENK